MEFDWKNTDPRTTPAGSPSDGDATTRATCTPRDAPAWAPVQLLGNYRILREIHRGGQGIVYLAIQAGTQRQVAIKVLRDGAIAEARDRVRFAREVRALGSLAHPGIVSIHDSGTDGDQAYFVMDYVEGPILSDFVKDRAPRVPDLVALFRAIADAVAAAHQAGVIHRDLKPANIRIDPQGRPRVLDFGLARLSGDELSPPTQTNITMTGQFIGSLPWASPEQASGQRSRIGPASDVYSLGVVLYQMLTEAFPYEVSGSLDDIRRAICETAPRPPRSLCSQIDRDLETILLKCLAKEPLRRYADAGQLTADLDRYLAGAPIEARRESALYRGSASLRHWLRRRRRTALVLVSAAAFLVGGFVYTNPPGVEAIDWRLRQLAVTSIQARAGAAWSDDIVVLGLDDRAVREARELAGVELPGFSPRNVLSLRRLDGVMYERLAAARPRVVALDIMYHVEAPEHDPFLARGLDALRAAGARVIAGTGRVFADGTPRLASVVATRIDGWSLVKLWQPKTGNLVRGVVLGSQRPPAPMAPGLALAAYAAWRYPEHSAEYDWSGLAFLTVRYRSRAEARGGRGAWAALVDEIPIGQFHAAALLDDEPASGDAPLSQRPTGTASAYTVLPPRDVVDRHTSTYSNALAMNDDELRRFFGGRIVVVGDMRTELTHHADVSRVPEVSGEREEYNCRYHAAAIGDLIDRRLGQKSTKAMDGALLALAAAAGSTIACATARLRSGAARTASRVGLAGGLGLVIFVAAAQGGIILSPTSAAVALVLALLGSSVVCRLRAPFGREVQSAASE